MRAYEKRLEVTSETTDQAIFTAPTAPSTSRAQDEGTAQSQPLSAPQDGFPDVAEEQFSFTKACIYINGRHCNTMNLK